MRRSSRSRRPSASWTSAACTTTPSNSPFVSTATWHLRPFRRLAASQPRGPLFRRLDALGVHDRRRGAGLAPFALAQHHDEAVAHVLPHARGQEGPEIAVHRLPRRERRGRQVPPLAARAHDVEQGVQHAPDVRLARSAAGLGGGDERLDQPILVVTQGLPRPEIPDQRTIRRRPHGDLRMGMPPRTPPEQPGAAHQARRATLSKRAVTNAGPMNQQPHSEPLTQATHRRCVSQPLGHQDIQRCHDGCWSCFSRSACFQS